MRFLVLLMTASAYAACPDLASQALPFTTIQSVALVTGGEVTPPGVSTAIQNLPKFCRVTGTLRPSADSDIRFEVWLPEEADWNGRYLGAGNGGFAGSINYGRFWIAVDTPGGVTSPPVTNATD